LILEFSETYNFTSAKFIAEMVRNLRSHGINFAIDDFGRGISELQLLYDFRPEIIKIDRYFVSGMVADHRKRLFVSTIVNLAHVLGIRVVIEGVETTEEFDLSWKLGGDLIQGYFIQPPSKDISLHKKEYAHISKLVKLRHEKVLNSHVIIEERVQEIKTLAINCQLNEVFETFRSSGNQDVFPVLNELGEPKGIICERDFKEFTYSPYGRELLKNKSYNKGLKDHIRKCPQLDKNTPVQEILDVHTYDQESSGIIITDNEKYYGFLSSEALIQISNDNRLNQALDQNPLSKLPGNITITKHIENCLQSDLKDHYFCYFDFDNFKPFNDIYGFREGDRAIILFADLLREVFRDSQNLIGHIGGDDFFASLPNYQANHLTRIMEELREKFSCNSECLYNSVDRNNRYIMAKDRIGRTRKFNLLSVSVGIVRVSKIQQISNSDSVFRNLAEAKKKAKFATTGVYISDYQDQPDTSFNNQENSAIQWLMTATNGFNERQAS
jgi:diguanylate cyclase (GGDEF)-like protein